MTTKHRTTDGRRAHPARSRGGAANGRRTLDSVARYLALATGAQDRADGAQQRAAELRARAYEAFVAFLEGVVAEGDALPVNLIEANRTIRRLRSGMFLVEHQGEHFVVAYVGSRVVYIVAHEPVVEVLARVPRAS